MTGLTLGVRIALVLIDLIVLGAIAVGTVRFHRRGMARLRGERRF